MDRKDAPPPYAETPSQGFSNPVGQSGFSNPGGQPGFSNPAGQPVYSYPAQTNYGYSAQPVFQQQQQQQMSNVVVSGGGWNQGSYASVPQDYTTSAWLACLCCFWPTGLIAIMRATESRDALARGDVAGAHIAANSARQMVRISFAVGLVSCICAVVFAVVWVVEIQNNLTYYDD